jgi:nitrite reductase/ring-hydroxylating ferredoxin subunit/DMSO/TMAO reductase YedYZ heme-binding membrane subunit
MSVEYKAIGWNPQKRAYDLVLIGLCVFYIAVFAGLGGLLYPSATAETLLIRASGTLALLMLHVILAIGPLCRLHPRFLPLLYNRRHLGVAMFIVALVHGAFTIFQFHALGDTNPLVSVLASNTRFASFADFPFELPGLVALIILFFMAATSHDFWLQVLTPVVWKTLHMGVYFAYALLIAHVALGILQSESSPALAGFLAIGIVTLSVLHLLAANRENKLDSSTTAAGDDGFAAVAEFDKIPDGRAKVVCLGNERIAVFRNGEKASAISNVCRHQNGPLGEGKIINGCVTCPWHGYQYDPDTGMSPPPFDDRVKVFPTRIVDGVVWVKAGIQ